VWPLRRPGVECPVTSFVAEAPRRPPEIANIACVSILETAADKFVALTRRAGAEIAGMDEPDPRWCATCTICTRFASTMIRPRS